MTGSPGDLATQPHLVFNPPMKNFLKLGVWASILVMALAAEIRARDIQAGAKAYSLGDYATALKQ
jgi:hypothetical protein